jgi:hypothetical protein
MMPKLWVAVMDDATCDYCAALDGTVIPDDVMWEVPPGSVHPYCRCTEVYISDKEADGIDIRWRDMEDDLYIPPEPAELNTPMYVYEKPVRTINPDLYIPWFLLLAADDEEEEISEEDIERVDRQALPPASRYFIYY